ncbi:MAG: hypothetical protein ACLR3C_09570 [Eggerthella lenta]
MSMGIERPIECYKGYAEGRFSVLDGYGRRVARGLSDGRGHAALRPA